VRVRFALSSTNLFVVLHRRRCVERTMSRDDRDDIHREGSSGDDRGEPAPARIERMSGAGDRPTSGAGGGPGVVVPLARRRSPLPDRGPDDDDPGPAAA